MTDVVAEQLEQFITTAENLTNEIEILRLREQVFIYLKQLFGDEVSQEFLNLGGTDWNDLPRYVGYLQALRVKVASGVPPASLPAVPPSTLDLEHAANEKPIGDKKVFVVHGHDIAAKEASARFLEKLGLDAIILHEQPNGGRTVIEKFEMFADVRFAVVLLTPDDVGHPVNDEEKSLPRARQNVILELGYFLGKLGRKRVAALCTDGVEIPSDYQGIVYIQLDDAGAWRTTLAQELIEAGMSIDLAGIVQGASNKAAGG